MVLHAKWGNSLYILNLDESDESVILNQTNKIIKWFHGLIQDGNPTIEPTRLLDKTHQRFHQSIHGLLFKDRTYAYKQKSASGSIAKFHGLHFKDRTNHTNKKVLQVPLNNSGPTFQQ